MMRPTQKLAVVAISASLLFAGAASSAQGAEPGPLPDPKETAGLDTMPLDITGDAALSEERDRLHALLSPLHDFDGGFIWDPETQVLNIQMISDAAIEEARELVGNAGTDLNTTLTRVKYSAQELDELADQLLGNQLEWAGAAGIGGGYDPKANRVVLQVDPGFSEAPTLIRAIENLNDARVNLQLIEPVETWAPESRLDDFAPWAAGASIDSATGGCTLGWTWKRRGSGQVVGSTARHCANLTWTNNETYLGTVFQSSPSADSALMSGTT